MIYRDPTMPTHRRVADLLQQMKLEEKLAQLGAVSAVDLLEGDPQDQTKFDNVFEHGVGWITMLAGHTSLRRQEIADETNRIQEHLINKTRLGIPAIFQDKSLAGFMASDATAFPEPLGLAASWRPGSARRIGSVVAAQMRQVGVHATLGPVLDIARDPRLWQLEETFGEDSHLAATLGLAALEGLQQGDGTGTVLAAAKHFVAESTLGQARSGAMNDAQRQATEAVLGPFEQLVRHANLAAIVHANQRFAGGPCATNRWLLTELLRERWGFTGIVLSEDGAIEALYKADGLADDLPGAAVMAIEAGVDLDLSPTGSFGQPLFEAIQRHQLDESSVDRAVSRVLKQKFDLGLFDEVFVLPTMAPGHDLNANTLAAEVASEALVLLKNEDDLLPLEPGLSLAVIGPNAADPRAMVGRNAHVARQELLAHWRDNPESDPVGIPKDLALNLGTTHFGSLADELEKNAKSVRYAIGAGIDSSDRSHIADAVAAANESDVAVLVLGDRSGLTPSHTTGGAANRTRIDLSEVQQELLEAVMATGTPSVLILLSGAPLSVVWAHQNVPSILWAILPGQAGAAALAETLFGEREPRGRLPITIARASDQLPLHYRDKTPSEDRRWWDHDEDEEHRPLWPFGHGLGYTTFELSTVTGPDSILTGDQELLITTTVENTGSRSGETIIQVYMENLSGQDLQPAQRLIWFGAIALNAGQRQTLTIRIPVGRLATLNHEAARVVAAGSVQLGIGFSAEAVKHRIEIDVIGTDRTVTIPPIAH